MKTNRLGGHTLRNEGRIYANPLEGFVNGPGRARCTCSAQSPELPNTAARKQWHREHKDAIRSQRGGTR